MKQILGKLFLLLLLTVNIFAEVLSSVQPQAVYKGEATSFVITANGENIEFPNIDEINGVRVEGTSTSQSINMVNMSVTKSTSKSYRFRPLKSMTIPSFEVRVDGKFLKTKALKIEVVKPTASKNGEPFVLELVADKSRVYVGEPIDVAVKLKYKMNTQVQKVQLGEPKLENFWIKKVENIEQSREGDYFVETAHYQFFPQKAGEYELSPIEALIGQKSRSNRRGMFANDFFNDSFFGEQLQWQKIYSNSLALTVNALPSGVELYGDFSIKVEVDKQKVQANKPVNLTITVEGEGNIDDVKKFELALDNAIVYADEPKVTSHQTENTFTQKIAIIADQNFTLPPISLKFFDKETQKVKVIKTEALSIEVIGGEKKTAEVAKIEMSPTTKAEIASVEKSETPTTVREPIVQEDSFVKYLYMLIGFIFGAGLSYLLLTFKNKEKTKENDMVKAIKKAKDDRALFELLLPYSKENSVISAALNLLEENLYKKGSNKIDRELLMEVFEEML